MAIVKSAWADGYKPMPIPAGSEVVNVLLSMNVTAAQTVDGDTYVMGYLPADCVLVDAVFAASEIDDGTAHAMKFGVLADDLASVETDLETGITVGQNGSAARLTPSPTTLTTKAGESADVPIGYEVTTSAGTGADGAVHVSLSYRSVAHGA